MSDAPRTFTVDESISLSRTIQVLLRFVRSLPFIRRYFVHLTLVSLFAVAVPQLFLWFTGVYTSCETNLCSAEIPFLSRSVAVTPTVLAWIIFLALVLRVLSWAFMELGGQWASQSIHRQMVAGMANVRTTYFDENPSGRLINRMVRDYETLTSQGVVRLNDTVQALLEVLVASGMVLFAHLGGGLLVLPMLAGFLYIQVHVAPMLQHLQALRSIRFGEVIHRTTDIIEGARDFELYRAGSALLDRLTTALKHYVQVHVVRSYVESWGRLWISGLTALYTSVSLALVAYSVNRGELSLVLASVIVTVLFRFAPSCLWFTWSTTFLIESMATARRTFEIADLPPETSEEMAHPRTQATAKLPPTGTLEFRNFTMSYRRDSPVILRGLSFSIPEGTRVGLVGRTGSGKTSIVQSIYRMVYVREGDISFGGVSLHEAPMNDARSRFAIVPQDAYLFEGTVRSNLDRYRRSSDEEIRRALEIAGLSVSPDQRIVEGGSNFSLGERQLLCLARVLLSDRPVVLMDEPTSGVDAINDARIQEFLAHHLRGKTVITIAHRLETLVNYDLILEIRDGELVRQGTPAEILPSLRFEDIS